MVNIKKRYFACLFLVVVALILYAYKENLMTYLTPILQTQFPTLTNDALYLITEIIVAILLVPPAIDVLYHFLSSQKRKENTPSTLLTML